jgi:thiol:disulfide interchange protein DsbD
VALARARGLPVFIDFTAAWCLTCKVNELTVLRSSAVEKVFKERKVQAFMADWTNQDPRISEALAAFKRTSVPLYVYYAPGSSEETLLPEILTYAIVRDVVGDQ